MLIKLLRWVNRRTISKSVLKYREVGKSQIDSWLSFVLLLWLFPLVVLIAASVWIMDGWPIFYSEERFTEGKRRFRIWKFRTMKVTEIECSHPWRPCDHKITRLGSILRTTKLDELPQLLNVFFGEAISFVGPRPWNARSSANAKACDPVKYDRRHCGKTGIMGISDLILPLTQDNGWVRKTLWWDDWYHRHCSLELDCLIVVLTLRKLIVTPIKKVLFPKACEG